MKKTKEKETKDIQILINKFHEIAEKKWIKSVNKGLGSIGYTFEKELQKETDSLYFPDYYGTEIKCTGRFSRYPITLFTVSFDGPTFPEINRLIEKWGYPDKDFKDKKIIFSNLSCKHKNLIESGVSFKLKIDYENEKIYLCVYDIDNTLIEKESFVYIDTIYKHLYLKLNKLALVYASKMNINNEIHFRYYKINVYKLKSFKIFLQLLEEEKIKVSLIARISKSGNDKGRYRNQNLVFKISKYYINRLYDQLYEFDYDKHSN